MPKVKPIYNGGMGWPLGTLGIVQDGEMKGWLCSRHPDGQWVSLADLNAVHPTGGDEFVCPECRSFDVHEVAYENDFGSMACNACGYKGVPGEDFPTSTETAEEITRLKAVLSDVLPILQSIRNGRKGCVGNSYIYTPQLDTETIDKLCTRMEGG